MCCGIRIFCNDGKVVIGRTLEFGLELDYSIYTDDKIKGIKGSVKNEKDSYFTDGINKHGLTVMAFYFPSFIQYADKPLKNHINIQSLQMVEYLLTNATSIDDIYFLCEHIIILNHIYKPVGFVFPLHWLCCDKDGRCIVIECISGIPVIYENKYGVMTNSPTFPEHIQYIDNVDVQELSPYNSKEKAAIQGQHENYSNGTGLVGLPGDYSSISRFIKLYILQKFHRKPVCIHSGINTAFHILNNFDIIKGLEINDDGSDVFTQYTIVYQPSTLNAFYKTYHNQTIQTF
jgi:penicillin V acylase-like amidase (Ntn superfamily)